MQAGGLFESSKGETQMAPETGDTVCYESQPESLKSEVGF